MGKKRGRPIGYRLSEESKRAISVSKMGQRHRQDTKDKISKTLSNYFKSQYPLSKEISRKYCKKNYDATILCWIDDAKYLLDEIDDVRTERSLRNSRRIEIAYGNNIEYFSHDLNPEILLLLKEKLAEMNIDLNDII